MLYQDWEYHPSKLPKDYAQIQNIMNELKTKFINEIQDNTACAEHFQKFNPDSVKNFIQHYANQTTNTHNV